MSKNYWDETMQRRLGRRGFLALLGAAGLSTAIAACSGSSSGESGAKRPQGWKDATHGGIEPDFAVVFPTDRVNQLTLTIAPNDWQEMLDDMTTLFGARGTGSGLGGQAPGQMLPGQMPPGGMQQGGGMGGAATATRKPMWVAGDVTFNGVTWTKVGIRFKGNSSLRQSWGTGKDSMPFKLDFDEFESQYPEIDGQRFYGFKQLSLSNNTGDASYIRETLAYDVFEAAGLPAANTAFYEVMLDRGAGVSSLGVYTVIEVVDDTLIDRVFGDDKGNIYEAEGSAASLAAGVTAAQIKLSFQKENNETEADWSDIEKFHSVINSVKRTSDNAGWRKDLEATFDVPGFLEWLAISATIQHWDTYGGMTHNYYLYNNEATGKLTWISWDHNFILGAMGGGGGNQPNQNAAPNNANRQGGGMAGRMNTSLDKKDVGAEWPLIRYLMDVPEYYEAYRQYLAETIAGPFNAAKLQAKYQSYAAFLGPLAEKQGTGVAFQTALQSLIQVTNARNQAVSDFLAT